MGIVNYYTVEGDMLAERSSPSTRVDYLHDALGSITGTTSQGGAAVNTYRYQPYGSQMSKSGSGSDPGFGWVGVKGYRKTLLAYGGCYVRARHYSEENGLWSAVDHMWPIEPAYIYAFGSPVLLIDPTGEMPHVDPGCKGKVLGVPEVFGQLCKAIRNPQKAKLIENCLSERHINAKGFIACLKKFCAGKGKVSCGSCDPSYPEWCRISPFCPAILILTVPCGVTECKSDHDPSSPLRICTNSETVNNSICPTDPLECNLAYLVALHEVIHVCAECVNVDNNAHQTPFNDAAECINHVIGGPGI